MSSAASLLLKLLYPTALAVVFLAAGVVFAKRRGVRLACSLVAAACLLICGNGTLGGELIRRLEARYPAPAPLPHADAILVLSGGVDARLAPRTTVEVGEAGDRVLHGARLYRQGLAPLVVCTGNVVKPGTGQRPTTDEMAELLASLGVPAEAILTEGGSGNTHEHAVNLCPVFASRGIRSVLVVTSAMHMPRAMGTLRRLCPSVTFTPAPTDHRWVEEARPGWYRRVEQAVPTPSNLVNFSDAAHEYLGLAYYQLRGWS